MLYVIFYMLYAICYMLYVICYMLYVICDMLYVICYMLYEYVLRFTSFKWPSSINNIANQNKWTFGNFA